MRWRQRGNDETQASALPLKIIGAILLVGLIAFLGFLFLSR